MASGIPKPIPIFVAVLSPPFAPSPTEFVIWSASAGVDDGPSADVELDFDEDALSGKELLGPPFPATDVTIVLVNTVLVKTVLVNTVLDIVLLVVAITA